jgi:hypothetical protein
MLAATRARFNFFPLGRRGGPSNQHLRASNDRNNVIARTWAPPDLKKTKHSPRHMLTLDCPLCKFRWDYETLTVYCPAEEAHNKREHWLAPDWRFHSEQPYRYYNSMPLTYNPRTGQRLADGCARRNNNERREQGLTTYARFLQRDSTGMARQVSGIGSYGNRWETHFPYPT